MPSTPPNAPRAAEEAPTPKRHSDYLRQAKSEFADQFAPMHAQLRPPPQFEPQGNTSAYAHARSASANGHERLAAQHERDGRFIQAAVEYSATVDSRAAELRAKRHDQKQHPKDTLAYKQHQHYIDSELSPRHDAAVRRKVAVKDEWEGRRATELKDADKPAR